MTIIKKKFINVLFMLGIVCLTGCNSIGVNMTKKTDTENKVQVIEEFNDYYQYKDSMKGIEIYVWYDNKISNWNCVLTGGTNRLKSVDEIKKLQDELPCPIDTMKEIVKYYHEYFSLPYIAIVSNPPTVDELSHSKTIEQMKNDNDFLDVLSKLGISKDLYFGDDKSNDSNDSSDETFLVQVIPSSFEFHNYIYVNENKKVEQQRIGDLLGYIIRPTDIQDFTEDYPNIDYVIYDGVYDYYNKNRVPFYQIVDDYNLDQICCNGNLYRKKL